MVARLKLPGCQPCGRPERMSREACSRSQTLNPLCFPRVEPLCLGLHALALFFAVKLKHRQPARVWGVLSRPWSCRNAQTMETQMLREKVRPFTLAAAVVLATSAVAVAQS